MAVSFWQTCGMCVAAICSTRPTNSEGKGDWNNVMSVDRILNHKGEQVRNEDLVEAFGTDDHVAIMQDIARHGEIRTCRSCLAYVYVCLLQLIVGALNRDKCG